MADVSHIRMTLLRAVYLLIFLGQGTIQAPRLIAHIQAGAVPFWNGVATSFLAALALLCAIGVRYPLQMLPLLVFEATWKILWLLTVALPLWSSGHLDSDALESLPSIASGLIVPLVIPWRFVRRRLQIGTNEATALFRDS